jgi:hypothetical protein
MNKYKLILSDESTKYFPFDNKIDAYILAFNEMLAYAEEHEEEEYALEFVSRKGTLGNAITFTYKIVGRKS